MYKNKDADQLCSNQRLLFHYKDSTVPLLLTSDISSLSSTNVTMKGRFESAVVNPKDRLSRVMPHNYNIF